MMSKKEDSILSGSTVFSGGIEITVRSYLSSHHLWAAYHFAELSGKIENAHVGRSAFNIEHRAYVMTAILSSVSFLEISINEIFQDAADKQSSYIKSLSSNTMLLFATYWQSVMKENRRDDVSILAKYEAALNLDGKESFSKGETPYQDVDLVIKLRNELIHFKPATQSTHDTDKSKLKEKLRDKFRLNTLMDNSGNPFFPDKCLGYGCAQWAVKSSRDFTDAFFSKLGIVPNYQAVNFPPYLEKN